MVVDEKAWDEIGQGDFKRAFGGWATFDNVPNQAYARNQLAITAGMKGNVGYVIEIEITKPINAHVGVVGPQGSATGGGNQLHFILQAADRSGAFKYVPGSGRVLP